MSCVICKDFVLREGSTHYCDECYRMVATIKTYAARANTTCASDSSQRCRVTASRKLGTKVEELSYRIIARNKGVIPHVVPRAVKEALLEFNENLVVEDKPTVRRTNGKKLEQRHYQRGVVGVYDNIADAAEKTGISRVSISRCLNGHQQSAGHCQWRWI